MYGRIVFGASAMLLGVIALMWHDSNTWQNLRPILGLPFGRVVGDCLMIAQIAGGIGMLHPRSARLASIVLGVVYLVFLLACLPAIIAGPAVYGSYIGFFEQLAILCGAIAVYAATETNPANAGAIARMARLGLGLSVVSFTLAQIFYFQLTVNLVPTWLPPNRAFWAILTTIAFALAAIAILANRQARLALQLLTLMLALFGVLVWIPLLIAHPEAHLNWSEFSLNFLITGAAWLVGELASVRGDIASSVS